MNRRFSFLLLTTALTACSLAPNFSPPDLNLPPSFKEQPVAAESPAEAGSWRKAEALEKQDRGSWWKIFGDEKLNELEQEAIAANQDLKAAAARVQEARSVAAANPSSFLPNVDIGANALRTKPASAQLAAFGQPPVPLKPYNMYSAQGALTYEADLFGRVRDNYHALLRDADAQAATYNSVLLAMQADVAQNYFTIRSLDAERALLRDTVKLREEANRIMQHRLKAGDIGEQDATRTQSELAGIQAELLALDRSRGKLEHALAVMMGKLPTDFTLAEAPLDALPPEIPAGLPSSLLERRPDIAAALFSMEAANDRIGAARAAFFPNIMLTASGGFESVTLADIFKWSSRTWALGQLAGSAITMPIFDNGVHMAQLDAAHAAYEESLAGYRQAVLVAFRDVEDNLVDQKLLAEQVKHANEAASAAQRTTDLTQKRYDSGDVDFFEVINAQRDSLAASRAAVQTRGARFIATVSLIRALGGDFEGASAAPADSVSAPAATTPPETATPAPAEKPVETAPAEKPAEATPTPVEKPAEAATPEQPAPEKPAEQPAPEKPAQPLPPTMEAPALQDQPVDIEQPQHIQMPGEKAEDDDIQPLIIPKPADTPAH